MITKNVALIVGSLRKDSWNRKLALELKRLAPDTLRMEIVEIGEMPLYNSDVDEPGIVPESWATFRSAMKQKDAVIFLTPEYNRGIPAVLKNAIDVGSRPYGQSIWDKKPGAVISTTPGGLGAYGANHMLRQCMVFLNVAMMQQPEMYISKIDTLFGDDGQLVKNSEPFIASFLQAFDDWAKHF